MAGPLPGWGPAERGGSGADVFGGGGISSGPGMDRLRASFIAGGWRYCLSSSVIPKKKCNELQKIHLHINQGNLIFRVRISGTN